ncbi:MAG: copper resistance protein [Alphaproteobacteria bacterium]|nr:copper resistance protein [Alphaproteobacteria bacterium]
MSKLGKISAVGLVMAGLSGNAAFAHPELQSAEPAAGSAATTSPQQIRITFSEAVIPQFSGVELKDQSGKPIATGKAAADPANRNVLVVPIGEPLPSGNYRVQWHAVGEDTHRVKGSYSFSVGR